MKQGLLLVEATPTSSEEPADELSRLGQQWAQSSTASFATYSYEGRFSQVEITGLQVEQFLNAGARVVEHANEHVITFAVPGDAINLRQQVRKFLLAQTAHSTGRRASSPG